MKQLQFVFFAIVGKDFYGCSFTVVERTSTTCIQYRFVSPYMHRQETLSKILLVYDTFNCMSQRIFLECQKLGYCVHQFEFTTAKDMIQTVEDIEPQIIICPYLTQRVPQEVYLNTTVPCWIVHPGIEGDRGISSLDWALYDNMERWGVTILQADKVMDGGDIWATIPFSTTLRNPSGVTKSSLYRFECINAAVEGIEISLNKFNNGERPRPLDYKNSSVKGIYRPRMPVSKRMVHWDAHPAIVRRKINACDSQPGALAVLHNVSYFVYGAHIEHNHEKQWNDIAPSTILGKRFGAVLIKCKNGAIWISHLKKENSIKLPATSVLPLKLIDALPIIEIQNLYFKLLTYPKTFQEIFIWEANNISYLWFTFYNGAMSTEQAIRLNQAQKYIQENSDSKIVVYMGSTDFFSNGINLNTIEAAKDPVLESWKNINAIDDVVQDILLCRNKITIAAMSSNAGAGGVMTALATDYVWAHDGVILNPSYKRMHLYGSEYWTFTLPMRVGAKNASEITNSLSPIAASQALEIGLIDKILCVSVNGFVEKVIHCAEVMVQAAHMDKTLEEKKKKINKQFEDTIASHRKDELEKIMSCFQNPVYHTSRRNFVYKSRNLDCVQSIVG